MTMAQLVWHNDGHSIDVVLRKELLEVVATHCPGTDECSHPETKCLVDWFLSMYGLELNVGTCEPTPNIPIAWTFVENGVLETSQAWIVPTSDPSFAAWYESMTDSNE